MSYASNPSQQISLNDRFHYLSERDKKIVLGSWAKPFAEDIFPLIREDRFAVLYSDIKASRPNTPVNVIIGALIIKEVLGLTDDEVVTGVVCDIRIQYALHTTSFGEQPLSDRTFSRFRRRLYEYEIETGQDLLKEEILSLSEGISNLMDLQPHLKRMDSLMVASACKDMTRLEVVYVTVSNLVNAVYRACGYEYLNGMEHYLNADDKNRVIYHNKAEDRAAKIQAIIEDGAALIERLGEAGSELPEYELVKRMLEDQSVTDDKGRRVAKNSHTIKPDSLQNPSDPDATYRKKAGKGNIGYTANVVQTFNNDGAAVITDYSFQQNGHSDSEFCKEAIGNIAESGEAKPDDRVTLIGDGAFGGADNDSLAKANNIDLVTTALVGTKPPEVFANFDMDNEGKQVLRCPAGHNPIKQGRNQVTDTYRIVMEKSHCANCPHREQCKVKFQKKSAVVSVSANKVERAKAACKISAEDYVQYRNARNAIEGIPSVLRRRYGVDDMPVFGLLQSKFYFGFKVAAINFKKLVKYTRQQCAHMIDQFSRQQCVHM
jgi:hypothetical protein